MLPVQPDSLQAKWKQRALFLESATTGRVVPGTQISEACHCVVDSVLRVWGTGNARDADSRYLLAQCCLQLGKLPEAEQALRADYHNADGVHATPLCPLLLQRLSGCLWASITRQRVAEESRRRAGAERGKWHMSLGAARVCVTPA